MADAPEKLEIPPISPVEAALIQQITTGGMCNPETIDRFIFFLRRRRMITDLIARDNFVPSEKLKEWPHD
jgi:hypothetical protein